MDIPQVYSLKFLKTIGYSIWPMADPSRTTAVVAGALVLDHFLACVIAFFGDDDLHQTVIVGMPDSHGGKSQSSIPRQLRYG